MPTCKVYGASDDLVEVEGALSAEFGAWGRDDNDPVFLALSDGTLMRLHYDDDGIWRIALLYTGEVSVVTILPGDVESDRMDVAVITSPRAFKWAACASAFED